MDGTPRESTTKNIGARKWVNDLFEDAGNDEIWMGERRRKETAGFNTE